MDHVMLTAERDIHSTRVNSTTQRKQIVLHVHHFIHVHCIPCYMCSTTHTQLYRCMYNSDPDKKELLSSAGWENIILRKLCNII